MIHFHKWETVRLELEVLQYQECKKCGKRRIVDFEDKKRNHVNKQWVKHKK